MIVSHALVAAARRSLPIVGLLALPAAVAAQDTIVWTDGTKAEDVRVTDFTLTQIEFRGKRGADAKPAPQVESVEVARVRDEYRRAFAAPLDQKVGTFLDTAKRLKDDDAFLAQFGYWEAARVLRDNGEPSQAILVLDELRKELPNSGYVPEYYRAKLDYYLGRGQLGNASTIADQYSLDAQTKGFPQGYNVEASYYKALVDSRKEKWSPEQIRDAMKRVLPSAAGLPDIKARARLQIANAWRFEGNHDEAGKIYRELSEESSVPADVRAGAYVGLGHVGLATAAGDSEANRAALLNFLRAYLMEDEAPGYAAEALHYGAAAAKEWKSPESRTIRRRLLGRLQRDYPESEYAKLR